MKPRIDIRPYIAEADYVLQLSNDMETYCYTINEALGYGVPIITTPLTILNELPITDNEHIVLDWNCENVDEVVKQIFEKKVKKFEYSPPEDNWENYIIKEKSKYKEEKQMKFLVEATDKYTNPQKYGVDARTISDNQRSDEETQKAGERIRYVPKEGEQWEVDFERKEKLVNEGFVKVIKEISEKKIVKETEKEPEKVEEKPKTRRKRKLID